MSGFFGPAIVDDVNVPHEPFPTVDDAAAEVVKIANTFTYNSRVMYMVFTPYNDAVGLGDACVSNAHPAGHTYTNAAGGIVEFAWVTYPQTASCRNYVNSSDDSLGHGYYDAYSIYAGHEWAEMVTDPLAVSWYLNNPDTGEVGDPCATNQLNFAWYGGYDHFANQRIWTNEWQGTGGCAYR